MKNLLISLMISGLLLFTGCNKDTTSDRFKMLTKPIWTTDSLLANGVDAGGTGQLLAKFKGDAKFKDDGTGYFGIYKGTWYFAYEETQIVIQTDSLLIPLTTLIKVLTTDELKVTTSYPNLVNPTNPISIRMTFKAK
jgi:hypothetical protein